MDKIKNLITAKDVFKKFGQKEVLKGVSLDLAAGEAVALLGENGSGKSTLLKTVVGIYKPNKGKVFLLGKDITSLSYSALRKIRAQIGFIFQQHNLVPRLSALTNVLHGALGRSSFSLYQAIAPTKLRQEALSCLDKVGLFSSALERAGNLSGGQSQRVAIARALMQKPKVILADEPVASLDPFAAQEVMKLLFSLCKQEGVALLFTTHNLQHAVTFSDRVVMIKDGVIHFNINSSELNVSEVEEMYGTANAI